MVLFLIYIVFIVLGIIFKKNKLVTISMFIFLWLLFGWSFGNADYGIYLMRYENYNQIWVTSSTEPLYTFLMKIFNNMNLPYEKFLIILSFVGLLLYFIIIRKNSKNPNMIIALYMIFPFAMDVCQIRYYISGIFVYLAISQLLKEGNGKGITIKFLLLIAIASMFHYGALFSLIFLIAKKLNIKKCVFATLIFIIIGFLVYGIINTVNILEINNSLFLKINKVILSAKKYNIKDIITMYIRIFVFFGGFVVLYNIFINYLRKNKNYYNSNEYAKLTKNIQMILKMNILMMIIIPLIPISIDLYRTQFLLSIINYIVLTDCMVPKEFITKNHMNKNNIIITGALLSYSFCLLFILVLSNNNINTVYRPLFENNIFFRR